MIRHRLSAVLLAMLLVTLALLTACGSNKTAEPSASSSAKPSASAAAPATASAPSGAEATIEIEHYMGKTKVPANPQRVVVLVNDAVEATLALGIKPVGMVKAWGVNDKYDHLKDQLEGTEIIGDENQPNLEAISALKPDLIIGNKLRQEKIYDQLSSIAPTVFSERTNSDMSKNFKLYAQALNREAEGAQKLAEFEKHVSDLKAKLGDKANAKISLVRFYLEDKVRLYYHDTFPGGILKQVGLQRPDSQNKEEFADIIGKERIPEADGDYLFYFTLEDAKGQTSATEKAWLEDSLWKNLNAVKQGKAIKVNDGVWNSSGGIIAANLMLDDLEKYLLQ
jgi:iron complex transport system substrate-binding protein